MSPLLTIGQTDRKVNQSLWFDDIQRWAPFPSINWSFPGVGPILHYKLMIFRGGPPIYIRNDFFKWCFFQKMNKRIRLYYYYISGRLVFVCFLEAIEDTKKTFRNWLTFSTYWEYITLSKGSRAKSTSPCAFRRKRRRKSKSSRAKSKSPCTFRRKRRRKSEG